MAAHLGSSALSTSDGDFDKLSSSHLRLIILSVERLSLSAVFGLGQSHGRSDFERFALGGPVPAVDSAAD